MFIPPFCPNHICKHHQKPVVKDNETWYVPYGSYHTKIKGEILRFKCLDCGKSFSTQTFHTSYYDKKRVSYAEILIHQPSCQGIRQTARTFSLNHKVIARRQAKLVPQALAFHARMLAWGQLDSTLVFDGFESFAHSQYWPTSIQLLAGDQSGVAWGFNTLTIRRKGRMTPEQKKQREVLEKRWKPQSRLLPERCAELFRSVAARVESGDETKVVTDEHKAYPKALLLAGLKAKWKHVTVNSKLPRTVINPLFMVNYLDRQLRKDLSEHVRETTRSASRPERQVGRLAVYLAWHNGRKPYRETGENRHTFHLEKAGLSREWIDKEWAELTEFRRFGTREPLQPWHRRIWNREDVNPSLTKAYQPKYLRVP